MSENEKMCDCNQGRLPCTCKPAEQHQSEPVAYQARHSASEPWFFTDKPGYWEWRPLYTQADPDEAEWSEMQQRLGDQNEALRAQLAEAHALLRQCCENEEGFSFDHDLLDRIKAALSTSAAPSYAENVLVVDAKSIVERTVPTPVAVPGRPVCVTGLRNAAGEPRSIEQLLHVAYRHKTIQVSREDLATLVGHAEDELEYGGTDLKEVVQRIRTALGATS